MLSGHTLPTTSGSPLRPSQTTKKVNCFNSPSGQVRDRPCSFASAPAPWPQPPPQRDLNRPGQSGDFVPCEGWSHVRTNVEEVYPGSGPVPQLPRRTAVLVLQLAVARDLRRDVRLEHRAGRRAARPCPAGAEATDDVTFTRPEDGPMATTALGGSLCLRSPG